MEPASRLIGKLRFPADTIAVEQLARAAWPKAVGKIVAARTRAVRMVRSTLIVEVEDATWQRQLFGLRHQILSNMAKKLGPGAVEDLDLRIVPLRRGPQRAAASEPAQPPDDADLISDPVLRSIYKNSRKKALA